MGSKAFLIVRISHEVISVVTGQVIMTEEKTSGGAEVDIYRDTPVRLLGYANEVGEAFRALVHVRWVRLSYGVASTYVVADTYDKGTKMSKVPGADKTQVAVAAFDTLLWQAFASVIVPGFFINRLCAFSLWGLGR